MFLSAVTASKHKWEKICSFLSPSDVLAALLGCSSIWEIKFCFDGCVHIHVDAFQNPCIAANPAACHGFVLFINILLFLASVVLTICCIFFPPLLHADDCREGWVSFF